MHRSERLDSGDEIYAVCFGRQASWSPAAPRSPSSQLAIQNGSISLDPAPNGDVIHRQATLHHHLLRRTIVIAGNSPTSTPVKRQFDLAKRRKPVA